MAKITFKRGDEYLLKLSKLGAASDEITKRAIYSAANVVTSEIRNRLKGNIENPASVAKHGGAPLKNQYTTADGIPKTIYESTGELEASLGISKIKMDSNGNWNAKIGFHGYDERHVPNQLKARAMESGTSKLKKRPFVRPAVNATRQTAIEKMKTVIDDEIAEMMK